MGRRKRTDHGKENRVAALEAAKEAAKGQLRAAKGITSKVKWAQIAMEHGVDRTTLRAHVADHGGVVRRRVGAGAPTVLPASAEEALADWLTMTAVAKKSPTERQVKEKAKQLAAKHKRQFNGPNGLPGKDWLKSFMRRHKISKRQQAVRSQARASSQEQYDRCEAFYKELHNVLQQPCDLRNPARVTTYAQNPHRIGNADESGVQRGMRFCKVLAPTGEFWGVKVYCVQACRAS